jgi:hypothetical protein
MNPGRRFFPILLASLALILPVPIAAAGHAVAPRGSPQRMTVSRNVFPAGDHDVRPGRVLVAVPFDLDDAWFYGPPLGAGYGWWGWPYADWGPYGPPYAGAYGYVRVIPSDAAGLELHVHPWKAEVRVDGASVGQARDHNGSYDALWLKPGRHVLTLSAPGFQTLKVALNAGGGGYLSLHERLQEGKGLDPRSIHVGKGGTDQR